MHEFTPLVADALAHLYDHPRLQTHELGRLLVPPGTEARGRALQRLLADAIGDLKPTDAAASAHAWRTYRYLFLRYVQALGPGEVARELGVSERQARRTYREAVDALSSLLAERRLEAPRAAESSTIEREVAQLASAGHGGSTDLSEVIAGLRSIVDPLARQHGCILEIALAPRLPRVALDRVVARQVVLNLAVATLERGAGQIRLGAEPADAAVLLSLRLHAAAPALPDPGRVEIARRLLESEGGIVELSTGDEEVVLTARLPAVRRTCVLVVDDNPDVSMVLRRYLEGANFEVATLDRGELALERARELRPAAIVLDVMMVGQDGWETLQQLKNHPETQETPVLVCSVLREPELARFLGAADLLPKPVSSPELLGALARLGLAPSTPEAAPPASLC